MIYRLYREVHFSSTIEYGKMGIVEKCIQRSLVGGILRGFSNAFWRGVFMPKKPLKPCSFPGCPNLTEGTYCEKHKKEQDKQYNKFLRSPDHNKKYGRNWRRVRERYIKLHPLCERCLKEGKFTPVEEVHHIIPVSRGGTNAESNLMSLCKSCHNKIHIELGDRHPHE